MKNSQLLFRARYTVFAMLGLLISLAGFSVSDADVNAARHLRADLDRLPLHFIENGGQLDPQVRFYVQGSDKTVYFTAGGVTLALERNRAAGSGRQFAAVSGDRSAPGDLAQRLALKLEFVGANAAVEPVGGDQAPALISYFSGPREEWRSGLRPYRKLVYRDLWPGIDLAYSGTAKRLKYMFIVKPGADPRQIRLAYRGIEALKIDDGGRLAVETSFGVFHDEKPAAYQMVSGAESAVAVVYHTAPQDHTGSFTYGFELGSYDSSLPLIIDPAILVYAGFIGGPGADRGNAIAVDAAGNAYVTGETASLGGFPVEEGPDTTHNGGVDAFVAKVAADGATLLYAGFIGGAGTDRGKGIAVDGAGNAYVVGESNSGVNFPVSGGLDPIHNGLFDAFVAKVNAAGTMLSYAGFIGGVLDDRGNAIALEQNCASSCAAYITGETSSSEGSFPDTVGPDITHNFGVDAFVAKINAAGNALVYAGFIGGTGTDRGKGIAVDAGGSAYVTGETNSQEGSFPDGNGFGSIPGFDRQSNGELDAFVVKVNTTGSGLDYATYIGGDNDDRGNGIAIEPGCAADCAAYITGETTSNQASFPVLDGPDLTHNGGVDAFVTKLDPDGASLVYSGYIGGNGDDRGHGIAVDGSDGAHVAGETTSSQGSFPVSEGPDLEHNGAIDGFVAQVNAAGTALFYAGYVGGKGNDIALAITVDAGGNIYIVGQTNSSAASFPEKVGPDVRPNGDSDAFVAKLCVSECSDVRVEVAATPNPVAVGDNVTYVISVSNDGPDTASNLSLTVTIPDATSFVSAAPGAPTCVFTDKLDCTLGDLDDGANTPVTLVLKAEGVAKLNVISSVTSDQTDTDPSNNEVTTKVTATLPNLVPNLLKLVKAALPGSQITIEETTTNRGSVGAGVSTTRVFFSADRVIDDPGDTVLYSRNVPALPPKTTDSASNPVTIPDVALGRYFIIAVADATSGVVETKERNVKVVSLLLTRPDLQIGALRAPGKVAAGANFTITDTTVNRSPLDAGASTTRFYLSTDNAFDAGDTLLVNRAVTALPPKGKSSDATIAAIPGGTPPGTYFLIAVADAAGAVTEADETDNARARKIVVMP